LAAIGLSALSMVHESLNVPYTGVIRADWNVSAAAISSSQLFGTATPWAAKISLL
jgi:hypothetical protein